MDKTKSIDNLYVSLQQAAEGNTAILEQQFNYTQWNQLKFIDGRLNQLLYYLKGKYSYEVVEKENLKVNSHISYAATRTIQQFEDEELEYFLAVYIAIFYKGSFEVEEGINVKVPALENFKGEDDTHSNNKLISYIKGKDNKLGAFELNVILPLLEKRLGTKRITRDGVSKKINENELGIFNYSNIDTTPAEDGSQIPADEIIGAEDEGYNLGEVINSQYVPTAELQFIRHNLHNILTRNQLEKFYQIVEAVESGSIHIDDLFNESYKQNRLKLTEIGNILYPDKPNNYIMPQVKSLLKSMRDGMTRALKQQYSRVEPELKSTYRKVKNISLTDNKLLEDYKIWQKYIIRDIEIDPYNDGLAVFKRPDQFIPFEEIERLERGDITVKGLIKKYLLTRRHADNPNGAVKHYIMADDGEVRYTDDELLEREEGHIKQLLDWIREGVITFKVDNATGLMKPNTNKIHSITYEDYYNLVGRPLVNIDDKVEFDIVSKYINRDYFINGSRFKLIDSYYVDVEENKYISSKRYISEGKKSQLKEEVVEDVFRIAI